MNRKIFAILSLAIVAIVCMGTASAFDLGSVFGGGDASTAETQNVTIGGIDFSIPASFDENKSLELVDEKMETAGIDYTVNEKSFYDSKDFVSILVADYGDYNVDDNVLKLMGGEKTTIGGVEGYLGQTDGFNNFNYQKDGKLITIVSTSDKIIEDFIA